MLFLMLIALFGYSTGFSLNFDNVERNPGESLLLPDERTSLNDCHLRYYLYSQFWRNPGYNGVPARLFEFAHMGAIGWTMPPDSSIEWRCGGSLITDRFVLTAAHCAVDSRNNPPDVVRFGDLDIFGPDGDEHAQQMKIAEIIRHPEHRFSTYYNDIALIRLVDSVSIGKSVAPACLWPDMEVRFTAMDAVGWGRVGFAGDQSPVLLKMAQSPILHKECAVVYNNETIRKLRSGLHKHHICASDVLTDTCEGDSGGPLQVKLMHNYRETPFIVAVTSFGLPCGTSNPGVYTRVAPYMDWIVATMKDRGERVTDQTFNTTSCARRYVALRDPYEGLIQFRNGTLVEVNYAFEHIRLDVKVPSYIAKLGWPVGSTGSDNCYGVIIDEDTLLTVADCVEYMGKPVSQIVTPQQIDVATIHIHPEYRKGASHNNIAILKLKNLLNFKLGTTASCIWHESELPYKLIETVGIGRKDLVQLLLQDQEILADPTQVMYRARITAYNESSCHLSKASLSSMRDGFAHEHLCAGNDFFLVPEVCNLPIGGPLFGTRWHNDREYGYTFALAQSGRDCGFGEHLLATRLWSHVDWMRSKLLPAHWQTSSKFVFLDRDRHEGDSCKAENRVDGRCVALGSCFQSQAEFLNRTDKQFCSSTDVVCCPLDVIRERAKAAERQTVLDECEMLVSKLGELSPYGFLVEIGSDSEENFYCQGSIISTQLIVTTRSCLGNSTATKVRPMANVNKTMFLENVIFHELYNVSDSTFDIALVKLKTPLTWSPQMYPACLWMNRTHTPLVTKMLTIDNNQVSDEVVQAKYNSDCQKVHPRTLHRSQLCVRIPEYGPVCRKSGDALMAQTESGINYLVGMALREAECSEWDYGTFTRISQLVGWIEGKMFELNTV